MEEVLVNHIFDSLDFLFVCWQGGVTVVRVLWLELAVLWLEVFGIYMWWRMAVQKLALWGVNIVRQCVLERGTSIPDACGVTTEFIATTASQKFSFAVFWKNLQITYFGTRKNNLKLGTTSRYCTILFEEPHRWKLDPWGIEFQSQAASQANSWSVYI